MVTQSAPTQNELGRVGTVLVQKRRSHKYDINMETRNIYHQALCLHIYDIDKNSLESLTFFFNTKSSKLTQLHPFSISTVYPHVA